MDGRSSCHVPDSYPEAQGANTVTDAVAVILDLFLIFDYICLLNPPSGFNL